MKLSELRQEIAIELESIASVLNELRALGTELGDRMPTVREKTAAAAFLARPV